jgi:hypothetical protein
MPASCAAARPRQTCRGDLDRLVGRRPPHPAQHRGEVLAVDVLHGQEHVAVDLADVIHTAHVRVRDLARDADFVPETRQLRRVPRHGLGQELERHRLAQFEVVGAVDLAHPPLDRAAPRSGNGCPGACPSRIVRGSWRRRQGRCRRQSRRMGQCGRRARGVEGRGGECGCVGDRRGNRRSAGGAEAPALGSAWAQRVQNAIRRTSLPRRVRNPGERRPTAGRRQHPSIRLGDATTVPPPAARSGCGARVGCVARYSPQMTAPAGRSPLLRLSPIM